MSRVAVHIGSRLTPMGAQAWLQRAPLVCMYTWAMVKSPYTRPGKCYNGDPISAVVHQRICRLVSLPQEDMITYLKP